MPKTLLGVALTLTAFGLVPGAAHVFELPIKLVYAPEFYAAITSTLYTWYGIAGGSIQLAAIVAVTLLAWRTRGRPEGALVSASAAALLISVVLWGVLVAPVNATWARSGVPGSGEFVAAYALLRPRWEWGHVTAFVGWLAGWFGLLTATLRAVPFAMVSRGASTRVRGGR